MQVLRKLVKGELSLEDDSVDIIRKTSRLAHVLINDLDSLFMFQDLLFKLVFPTRGQKARALLILNPQDLGRIALRHHGLAHRGALYTYTILANRYYTVNMYQTILDQIKGCSVCADFHLNKKKSYTALTNVLDLSSISQISVDLKGPLERAPTTPSKKKGNPWDEKRVRKFWILCIVNPITGLNQFFYLPDKKASTVVRCLYEKFIRFHSGITHVQLDEGPEFTNACQAELASLMKFSLKFTCKANPRANRGEGSVQKLSHLLKAVLQGSEFRIKDKLTDLSIISNSVYFSEISGRAANDAHGVSNGDALAYSPAIICGKEEYRHKGQHWTDVSDSMREIVRLIREHYNCFITLKRSNLHTFESLNIKKGDVVYFRSYSKAHPVSIGLKSLCPSWNLGRVETILSRSAAIIKNIQTDARVRRHISDIHPIWDQGSWALTSNWKDNFDSYQTEKAGLDLSDSVEMAKKRDDDAIKARSANQASRGEDNPPAGPTKVTDGRSRDEKLSLKNDRVSKSDKSVKSNKGSKTDRPKHRESDDHKVSPKPRTRLRSKYDGASEDDLKMTEDVMSKIRKAKKSTKSVSERKNHDEGDDWSIKGNNGSLKRRSRKSSNRASRTVDSDDHEDEDSQDSLPSKDNRRRSKRLARKPRVDYRE